MSLRVKVSLVVYLILTERFLSRVLALAICSVCECIEDLGLYCLDQDLGQFNDEDDLGTFGLHFPVIDLRGSSGINTKIFSCISLAGVRKIFLSGTGISCSSLNLAHCLPQLLCVGDDSVSSTTASWVENFTLPVEINSTTLSNINATEISALGDSTGIKIGVSVAIILTIIIIITSALVIRKRRAVRARLNAIRVRYTRPPTRGYTRYTNDLARAEQALRDAGITIGTPAPDPNPETIEMGEYSGGNSVASSSSGETSFTEALFNYMMKKIA